ncbi:MAG: DUF488 domain-containing protein [Chitinophagaceae bacterium]|nr:DUF488 domain-containing protein [Chitinophagaceae bacterium]
MKPVMIIRRVYDEPLSTDGYRVLVDRLWPRGLTKEKASLDEWIKDIAPSAALRKWFDHTVELWPEFRKRYTAELKANEDAVNRFINELLKQKHITLLYAAKDPDHNNAVVLKQFLEKKM